MTADAKPTALVVYFTFSQQTGRVAEVMEEALAEKGYDVTRSAIEFTDPHWTKVLSGVPMRRPALQIPRILVAQRMRKTGEIRIPEEAHARRLRPRRDRIPDLVADHEHADSLLPEVVRRQDRPGRQAVRGLLGLAALLEGQHEGRQEARRGQRRTLARRDPLPRRRRPGQVDALLARLHEARRAAGEGLRHDDAPAEPEARLRAAGAHLHRSGRTQDRGASGRGASAD